MSVQKNIRLVILDENENLIGTPITLNVNGIPYTFANDSLISVPTETNLLFSVSAAGYNSFQNTFFFPYSVSPALNNNTVVVVLSSTPALKSAFYATVIQCDNKVCYYSTTSNSGTNIEWELNDGVHTIQKQTGNYGCFSLIYEGKYKLKQCVKDLSTEDCSEIEFEYKSPLPKILSFNYACTNYDNNPCNNIQPFIVTDNPTVECENIITIENDLNCENGVSFNTNNPTVNCENTINIENESLVCENIITIESELI